MTKERIEEIRRHSDLCHALAAIEVAELLDWISEQAEQIAGMRKALESIAQYDHAARAALAAAKEQT